MSSCWISYQDRTDSLPFPSLPKPGLSMPIAKGPLYFWTSKASRKYFFTSTWTQCHFLSRLFFFVWVFVIFFFWQYCGLNSGPST
jgi:hypothetical protein